MLCTCHPMLVVLCISVFLMETIVMQLHNILSNCNANGYSQDTGIMLCHHSLKISFLDSLMCNINVRIQSRY